MTKDDMEMMQPILQKIAVGDGLTDSELRVAVEFYDDLRDKLSLLGPRFQLAWEPVFHRSMQLQGFLEARRKK